MMPVWPPNCDQVFRSLPQSARGDSGSVMAATTITTRPPAPVEIARATAAAIPSELSTRPLSGILGVLIGAGLVTLTGRMLSLGMADLKGHVGISYDQGAWLDSAYNAAVMFIGPFTVYLGGLLGPRRVLMFAAGLFTVTCAFLPLIHSYSLLVTALVVLEFSPDCAADADLYLFRDTESSCPKEGEPGTQLRRISVPECRIGTDVYRPPARPEARLVALRCIHRLVLVRRVPHIVRSHPAATRPQPAGSPPLSLAMEHCAAG